MGRNVVIVDVVAATTTTTTAVPIPGSPRRRRAAADMALSCMRARRFADGVRLLNMVIELEAEAAAASDGTEEVDHRFFVNRGDCHRALGHLQQVRVRVCALGSELVRCQRFCDRSVPHASLACVGPVRLPPRHRRGAAQLGGAHAPGHAARHVRRAAVQPGACRARRRALRCARSLGCLTDAVPLAPQHEYAHADVEFSTAISYNSKISAIFVHRGDTRHLQQVRNVPLTPRGPPADPL